MIEDNVIPPGRKLDKLVAEKLGFEIKEESIRVNDEWVEELLIDKVPSNSHVPDFSLPETPKPVTLPKISTEPYIYERLVRYLKELGFTARSAPLGDEIYYCMFVRTTEFLSASLQARTIPSFTTYGVTPLHALCLGILQVPSDHFTD